MTDINHVTFSGNLGADPVYSTTANGKGKCIAGLYVDTPEKDKEGNYQKNTTKYQLVAWDKSANILRLMKKGWKVYVEGKQQERKWEKDGVAHAYIEITVRLVFRVDMSVMGAGNSSAPQSGFSEENLAEEPPF